ncbi:MAG TPA: RNA polymerase sigma factor [Polyangiaceae bacterium]|nr:RNA polymerase sigma factor [Polyangiaceae bacterium]
MPPSPAALEPPTWNGTAGQGAAFFSPKDFENLYTSYFLHVTRWVRAFGCPPADVDDLAQETFLVARKRLSQFEGGNVAGWLYRIAQHVTRGHLRRSWVRRVLYRDPDLRTADTRNSSPIEELEQREARNQMYDILSRMTKRRRSSFFLFDVEGYTGEEIAALEGVSVNTIYTRLHFARRDFMSLLARAEGQEPAT